MSSKLTWKLNGVDLDDGSLGLIVEPSMWRPPVAARLTNVLIPGQHGDIMPGLPVFEAPLLTLSVWRAATQPSIEAATNALLALLAQPSLTLSRESGGVVASAPVKLVSAQFDNFIVDSTSRATAVLRVPGVFFRSSVLPLSELRRNQCTTPRAAASWNVAAGTGGTVTPTTEADARFRGGSARRGVWSVAPTTTSTAYIAAAPGGIAMAIGESAVIAIRYAVAGYSGLLTVLMSNSGGGLYSYGPMSTIDHGDGTFTVWRTVTCTTAGSAAFPYLVVSQAATAGMDLRVGDAFVEKGVSSFGGYFDGDYSATGLPSWTGATNASASIVSSASELNFSADFDSVAIPALDGSTAPITDPILRILGPVTNPVIRNPTSGTSIGYTGTVPAGQYLFIRLDNLSARISTTATNWMSGGTTVTANLTYNPRGILQLWPAISGDPYTRPVLVSATGTGKTAATRLAIQAARSYL